MSLESDVKIPAAKFDRSTIDKQTLEFNEKLIKIWADGPRWYEVRRVLLFLPSLAPLSLTMVDRSEPRRTAKCAGKAKLPLPSPSFCRKV
jgi:hypothetical protein